MGNLKITQEKIAKIVAKYKKDTNKKINKQPHKQQTKILSPHIENKYKTMNYEVHKKEITKNKSQHTYVEESKQVFFEDVIGMDDTRYELEELVTFFREPEKYKASGAFV